MNSTTGADIGPILVIGYGSSLRGDDAIGRDVASAVGEWDAYHVHAISVHQLTPELAVPISTALAVIFVDADITKAGNSVKMRSIGHSGVISSLPHAADPCGLLALTEALYDCTPEAWLVTIPVESTGLGEQMTAAAVRGGAAALSLICDFVIKRFGEMPVSINVLEESRCA